MLINHLILVILLWFVCSCEGRLINLHFIRSRYRHLCLVYQYLLALIVVFYIDIFLFIVAVVRIDLCRLQLLDAKFLPKSMSRCLLLLFIFCCFLSIIEEIYSCFERHVADC